MSATLTTLVGFNSTDGDEPRADLIADAAGDLFGTGGVSEPGTLLEIVKTLRQYGGPGLVAQAALAHGQQVGGVEASPDRAIPAEITKGK